MQARRRLGVAGVALCVLSGGCADCANRRTPSPSWSLPPASGSSGPAFGEATPPQPSIVRVPRVATPPRLDGELTEWETAGRTGTFAAHDGTPVHPYSEARFFWDDQNLYVGLYAADQNIEYRVQRHDDPALALAGDPDAPHGSDDAFRIRFGPDAKHPFEIDVNAGGVFSDAKTGDDGKLDFSWESHMRLAIDRDGTPNDPRDDDEEWVIEAAIPFSSLGIEPKAGAILSMDIARCDTPKGGTVACGMFGELASVPEGGRIELIADAKP